ncbi:hypothetical protein DRN46_01660 [Thermococci archaeon]|nr:MAG: hypothetical protein DRN46_01660 [Thermococci archaeon]
MGGQQNDKHEDEKVLEELYKICREVLPEHKNKTGHKGINTLQQIAMWLHGMIFNLTSRDTQEEFIISRRFRRIIGLFREGSLLYDDLQSCRQANRRRSGEDF